MPTREVELKNAIEAANIPPRDYRVYSALLKRAEWGSAVILPKFQPRSLAEVARLAKVSIATAKRALAHLESHGWLLRDRQPPGRGHATSYRLLHGSDCDCIPQRPEPTSDAERARRYRQRKKAAQSHVTLIAKVAQSGPLPPEKAAQIDVTKRLTSRDDVAGQGQFSAKSVRDEERGMRVHSNPDDTWLSSQTFPGSWSSWSEGTIGAEMNRNTDLHHRRAA